MRGLASKYGAGAQRVGLRVAFPTGVLTVAALLLVGLVGFGVGAALHGGAGAASAAPLATTHIKLDIMPAKPLGPAQNWPAYLPSTNLTVPANSLITVTIRNFDLGDMNVPADFPFSAVQGTVGGVAYADGHPYSLLGLDKSAHTFTIPQLHVNVPIPGDAANGSYVTVTFSFRSTSAGKYYWQCFIPCGTGPNGFGGPMGAPGFMRGSFTITS
jgi:hypothetical protein